MPPILAQRTNKVVRPRDAADIYARPRGELSRLARLGVVRRIATGYYALAPQHRLGDTTWIPALEAAALGIAQSDYGIAETALMGVSAARHHGALPRALAVAVAAVPKQRPTLHTDFGQIVFVRRDVTQLEVERIDTELTTGWVTTVEQTLLDLAHRPTLGGLSEDDLRSVIRALANRADWELVTELAHDQHKPGALREALTLAGDDHA